MMKEIKFRIWNGKEWLQDDHELAKYVIDREGKVFFITKYKFEDVVLPYEDKVEINLYTGMKDNKGQDIYEGDIIKFVPAFSIREKYNLSHKDIIGKVYWSAGAFRVKAGDLVIELADCLHKKVIGNIYENPELLEV